jgi:predicted amidophosphoribosyltransferase
MNGRCYLCLKRTTHKSSILCNSCFCFTQNYQCIACAHCGFSNCAGCKSLNDFDNVTSCYNYQNPLAQIFSLAKDENNKNMQMLFNELFFVPVKNKISSIIKNDNYSHIILSPLRKERILKSSWHTNIFFESVLDYIFTNEIKEKKPLILYPYYTKNKIKQSLLSNYERHINSDKINIKFNENLNIKSELCEKYNQVLFIDDVLTTGQTAIQSKRQIEKIIPNKNWNLFSIFRSLQSLDREK